MKKTLVLFVLFSLLFLPNVAHATYKDEAKKAIQETADAFYRKGNLNKTSGSYIKYSNPKKVSIITPEMATSQNIVYNQCASFVRHIYKDAFNVELRDGTLHLGGCAVLKKDNEDIVKKIWSINKKISSDKPSSITIKQLANIVQTGDIIIAIQSNGGHTMLVYDNSNSGITLIESNQTSKTTNLGVNVQINYSGAIQKLDASSRLNYLKNSKEVIVIRPLGDNYDNYGINFNSIQHKEGSLYDMTTWKCGDNKSVDINLTDSAKCRVSYPGMDINKSITSRAGVSNNDKRVLNNSEVDPDDVLEYSIEIKNNSKQDYKNLKVTENLSQYVLFKETSTGEYNEVNKQINWTINVPAQSKTTLTYKVKVKSDVAGKLIESTGTVCNIPSLTIKNKVSNHRRNNFQFQKAIKDSYNKNQNLGTDSQLINQIYKDVLGIDGILSGFRLEELVISEKKHTVPLGIYLNQNNKFYNMVYNNYYGGITYNEEKQTYHYRYWENHWLAYPLDKRYNFNGSRVDRADTIYDKHFETGDILVFSDKEDGKNPKMYIYVTDGFYGINNTKYPSEDMTKAYGKFALNLLFDKGLYVVLRPLQKYAYTETIITLLDYNSKEPIKGAIIKIQKKDGDKLTDIGSYITNDEGKIIKNSLLPGKYVLTQTKYMNEYEETSFKFYTDNKLNNEIISFDLAVNDELNIYATNTRKKYASIENNDKNTGNRDQNTEKEKTDKNPLTSNFWYIPICVFGILFIVFVIWYYTKKKNK